MRVLLAEDSVIYQKLVGDYVKEWGFDLTVTGNGADAWQILRQPDSPKLVLLDWVLPDFDGIEICRKLRRLKHQERYTYTVLLTGRKDKQDPVLAMEAAADDLLFKPFDAIELKARLFAGKRILELQEQLLATHESLRFAATHDAFTGLWNRAGALETLNRELARSRRTGDPVGVGLVDIDHFKAINDAAGHAAGDAVLKRVAQILSSRVRDYDAAGRYGGEEFLLVMPGCDLPTMKARADEIRAAIAATQFESVPEGHVTVSIGVTAVSATVNLDREQLLHDIDDALYSAKRKGRNRVEAAEDTAVVPGAKPLVSVCAKDEGVAAKRA